MPDPYFVALLPDAPLSDLLLECKQRTRELAGDQLYLSDPPHLTLYVGLFEPAAPLLDALDEAVRGMRTPSGTLAGWHVYEADPLTGRVTLTCAIRPGDSWAFRATQAAVIDAIAPLRDADACRARYAVRMHVLSPERRDAVERVGFPFVGDDWQPHLSVASIDPPAWPTVWDALRERDPRFGFACPRLGLFRLDGVTPVPVTEWAL